MTRQTPALEGWLSRRPILVAVLAAGAAAACGWILLPISFGLSAGAAAAVDVGWFGPRLNLARLRGELRFDAPRIRAGQSVGVALSVRNPWRRRWSAKSFAAGSATPSGA